uniref:chitinase n=1 Tax=Cyclopterus lumpus TaxID=8103 RepID=A0A8C3GAM2_CYCLU
FNAVIFNVIPFYYIYTFVLCRRKICALSEIAINTYLTIIPLGLPGLAFRSGNPCHGKKCDNPAQTTSTPTGHCHGKADGNYPKTDDQHSFYQCVAGITYVQPCPAGLVYSSSNNRCDYPAQTTSTPTGHCHGKADGNYPKPDDQHSFYQCVAGITYVQPCPAGLVYSSSKNLCDYPAQTTSTPTGFCHGKADGNYPKPDDQHSFYQCVAGITYVQPCPAGLVYSSSKNRCDYPAQTTSTPTGHCHGKADGNYPKPDDQHSFYQCVAGITYVQPCPAGLVYSSSNNRCDYPAQTTSTPTGHCHGKADGNYPKPDDQHSFYQCVAGITYVQPCPAGLVYSSSKNLCDYPAQTTSTPTGFCHGKADGNYPKPDDQHSFYQCVAGITYVQPCPAGLVYSSSKNRCDYPAQTTSTPTGHCHGKADGNYPKTDDQHSFYQCVAGITYVQPCPAGLVYSSSNNRCDYPAQTTSTPTGHCHGKADGNYPKPDDQHSFYQCVAGITYVQPCPAGLVYSSSKNLCDYPAQTTSTPTGFCHGKADGNYPKPDDQHSFYQCVAGITYVQPCPAGLVYSSSNNRCDYPAQTTSTPTGHCHGKADGNYPKPDDQHSFYQCVAGITYVQPCPAGLVYSSSKNLCDYPAQTTSTPTGFCHGKADGNYPKPDDQHSFYQCVAGITYVQPCPAGLVYSSSKNRCDYPAQTTSTPTGHCHGKADGNYPKTDDQHSFYQCVAGITYVQPCPAGLVYSSSNNRCDYPAQTTSTPTGHCHGKADGNYPKPDDQHSFYQCVAGITYVQPCPAGLVYSSSKNLCDYPAQTTSTPTGFCHGKADGNYPKPDDQHSFYQCVAGITYVQPCPADV